MSGAQLIAKFGKEYPVVRFASSVQTKQITFDADFVVGNEINLLVDAESVGPIPFNGTHSQTLQDLADAIADVATINTATVSGARSIDIEALDAGNTILIFKLLVTGGATQPLGDTETASGGYVDGDYQDGATTTFTAVISLQPITGQELVLLKEGNRSKRYLRGYTSTRLFTETESSASNADRIEYDSQIFEVLEVEKWTPMDLNHYSVLLAQVNDEHKT